MLLALRVLSSLLPRRQNSSGGERNHGTAGPRLTDFVPFMEFYVLLEDPLIILSSATGLRLLHLFRVELLYFFGKVLLNREGIARGSAVLLSFAHRVIKILSNRNHVSSRTG